MEARDPLPPRRFRGILEVAHSRCRDILSVLEMEHPRIAVKEMLMKIVEEKDASQEEKSIKEVSSSHYCFDKTKLFNAKDFNLLRCP